MKIKISPIIWDNRVTSSNYDISISVFSNKHCKDVQIKNTTEIEIADSLYCEVVQ